MQLEKLELGNCSTERRPVYIGYCIIEYRIMLLSYGQVARY